MLTVRTGSEGECIGVTGRAIMADPEAPQPVDHDGLYVGIGQLAEEIAGAGVERVDVAVAEIADQYVAAKLAEGRRSQHHAPRRIELFTLGELHLHVTAEVKGVHEAAAVAGKVVMLCLILPGIGDKQRGAGFEADFGDVERCVAGRQLGIGERIGRRSYLMKRRVRDLDVAGGETSAVRTRMPSAGPRQYKADVAGALDRY